MYKETASLLSEKVRFYQEEGRRVFLTSSFQTQSVPLLHLISEACPEVPVVFINTGFLFPETYAYKDELAKRFSLKVIELNSSTPLHLQKDENNLFYYSSNTDYCCHLNKVLPLDNWMKSGDVWISGVRRDQSAIRKAMKQVEERDNNVIRFHPMLKWTGKDIYHYINKYDLLKHPLEHKGYSSIGCVPCTASCKDSRNREGRWVGQQKTECGLHTEI